MILRPVTPQSPFGPPISNAPVGLTRYLTGPFAVDAARDVRRLLAVRDEDGAGGGVEADRRVGVADAADGPARHLVVVHARAAGDLAGEHDQVVLHQRLGGDARGLVLL